MGILLTILEIVGGLLLAYWLFMHLLGPVLVKRSERLPMAYQFERLDDARFFADRSETFIMLDLDARNLGLQYVGSSVLKNTNANSYFSLYTGASPVVSLMLVTLESPLGDFTYAEFSRLLDNGGSVEISNAPISPLFPENPIKRQLRYPEINHLGTLHDAALKLMAGLQGPAQPVSLSVGAEFQQVTEILNDEIQRMVQLGYYQSQAVDGFYPISLKGAILFSWKSLWPWQQLRQGWDVYCSRRLL